MSTNIESAVSKFQVILQHSAYRLLHAVFPFSDPNYSQAFRITWYDLDPNHSGLRIVLHDLSIRRNGQSEYLILRSVNPKTDVSRAIKVSTERRILSDSEVIRLLR